MPTTTATISITNDISSVPVNISASFNLLQAGSSEGMDSMTSKRLILKSTNQVDLLEYTAATVGGVASTHNFLYISNASTTYMLEIGCLFLGAQRQQQMIFV